MYKAINLHANIGEVLSTHKHGDLVIISVTERTSSTLNSFICRGLTTSQVFRYWPHTGLFEPLPGLSEALSIADRNVWGQANAR